MGKPIKQENISNLGKPGFRRGRKFCQHMLSSNVQGILWEGGDHAEETDLP